MLERKKYFILIGLLLKLYTSSIEIHAQNYSVLQNPEQFWYERLVSDSSKHLTLIQNIIYEDKPNYFKILSPRVSTSFNTTYARSYNDGPLWKGKGLTQDLDFGFQWKKGPIRLNIEPFIYFSQNAPFDLASVSPNQNPYNYQFGVSGNLDFVQRYGKGSFTKFHPGQSEIALSFKQISFSLSTQNFTLGPAINNHIIMGNSSGGFPHFLFGTPEKIPLQFKSIDLGAIEANVFYGLLSESKYFDSISNNNYRYINGLAIGYEIPYLEGLTVGFQRVMYKRSRFFESADLYSMFYIKDNGIFINSSGDTLSTGNDTFDQMASAFIDWKIISQDLRLYFEFARNDFNGSLRRFITEFEHGRAYTLGFEKIFNLNSKKQLYLGYEHTFLPRYMSYQYRPNQPFYIHEIIHQGYTNDGQILGAGIGPGSVSDKYKMTWFGQNQQMGFALQRIRFNEDYFITAIANSLAKINQHDIELTLSINYTKKFEKIYFGVASDLSYRFNMYFISANDKVNFGGNIFVHYLLNQNRK